MSIDVEDWFQVENLKMGIKRNTWDQQELRVKTNIDKILQLLSAKGVKATFFVLGWIADRYPGMVKNIAKQGHEIASHGYNHISIPDMSEKMFKEDVQRSKKLLEDLTGQKVIGYRAPSFSITPWAIAILKEVDYLYDSSYFHVPYHDRYGKLEIQENDSLIVPLEDEFFEIQIPTIDFFKKRIPWGGGGYFRFYPYPLYYMGVKLILKKRGNFLFYFHPWEVDPLQPRIKSIDRVYYFRHYYGLKGTEFKIKRLLDDFRFVPIKTVLEENFLKKEV